MKGSRSCYWLSIPSLSQIPKGGRSQMELDLHRGRTFGLGTGTLQRISNELRWVAKDRWSIAPSQISSKTRFKEERAERDCTPARSRPPCDAVSPSTANPSRLNEMTQQSDDLAMLSRAFEDALTELLLEVLMEGGTSFDRQMKLRLARNRLRRHKDFTEKEYQAAVLRAARRALPSE